MQAGAKLRAPLRSTRAHTHTHLRRVGVTAPPPCTRNTRGVARPVRDVAQRPRPPPRRRPASPGSPPTHGVERGASWPPYLACAGAPILSLRPKP
ncbi:hypothetical protein OBBRIDRAFT_832543 [Obba rivulosa]|uniref:Uncharacterized protein n=1 Tax=Obba rivulosa TaxID=1052685 RepID=A0A8E2DQ18_9APHY|nr:hypothetical protein OBBRIDRAFT_832543 [Obba rivulosa]